MFPTLPLCIQAASAPFKRSQLGLFHGKCIQFGNNVPFSKHKTRRTWHPNVQSKDLRSDVLGRTLNIKVTTRALRTIKKVSRVVKMSSRLVATELFSEVRRTGQVRLEHAARITGLRGHADTHDGAREDGGRCGGCEALKSL